MTGLDLQVPLIFNVRASASSCACLDLETFAASKTMWTPPPLWTHRTRPQGFGNLAQNARFPQRRHRSLS